MSLNAMSKLSLSKRPHHLLLSRFFSQGLIAAILVTLLTGWVLTRLEKENYLRYAMETAQERVDRVAERISHQMSGMMADQSMSTMMQTQMGGTTPVQRLIETETEYGSMVRLEVADASGIIIGAADAARLGKRSDLEEVAQAADTGQKIVRLLQEGQMTVLRYAVPVQIEDKAYVIVVDEPLTKMQAALQTSAQTVTVLLWIGFILTFASLSTIVRRAGLDIEYHQREENRVKDLLGRYVSHQVARQILSSGAFSTQGERRRITVLFADIRGFTAFSELLPPEQVVVLLNDFLEAMTDVVFRYDGTLDKFLGDGLMVIFGAPVDLHDDVERALACAVEMQARFRQLKQRWQEYPGAADLALGIGINTGEAIVGNIGSARRLDYTAIGDVVNTAARLESIAEAGQILLSQATWERLPDKSRARPLGARRLKGKRQAIPIYEI